MKTPNQEFVRSIPTPWISSINDLDSEKKTEKLLAWLTEYGKNQINSRLIDERRCIPPNIILELGNHGLLGMNIDKQYGGLQLDYKDIFRIIDCLATIDTTLAIFVGLNNVLGNFPITQHASIENREKILPDLATGVCLACFALTEDGAGSNPRAMSATATPRNKNHWIINGEKIWVGSAAWAAYINVFVQLADEHGQEIGITGFTINLDRPGITIGEEAITMGVRGMIQSRVIFHNVEVSHKDLLGRPGDGFKIAQHTLLLGRVGISAVCLGALKKSFIAAYNYSQNRQIITGQLLDNPIIQIKLSHQIFRIMLLEKLNAYITNSLDEKLSIPEEIYIIFKVIAPELLWTTIDDTMQILGGRGYIETNLIPQLLRDARLLRIFEGPTEALSFHLGTLIFHSSENLTLFLDEQFNKPAEIEFLKGLITHYKKERQRVSNSNDQHILNKWLYDFGQLSAYVIAKMIYNTMSINENKDGCILWLNKKIAELTANLNELYDSSSILNPSTLAQYANQYQQIMNSLEQYHPGVDFEIDGLMKK